MRMHSGACALPDTFLLSKVIKNILSLSSKSNAQVWWEPKVIGTIILGFWPLGIYRQSKFTFGTVNPWKSEFRNSTCLSCLHCIMYDTCMLLRLVVHPYYFTKVRLWINFLLSNLGALVFRYLSITYRYTIQLYIDNPNYAVKITIEWHNSTFHGRMCDRDARRHNQGHERDSSSVSIYRDSVFLEAHRGGGCHMRRLTLGAARALEAGPGYGPQRRHLAAPLPRLAWRVPKIDVFPCCSYISKGNPDAFKCYVHIYK